MTITRTDADVLQAQTASRLNQCRDDVLALIESMVEVPPPPPAPEPEPPPPPPPPPPPEDHDDPMTDVIPDVSGDPDAIQVQPGATLVVHGPVVCSTLLIHPGGRLIMEPGTEIVFLDRQPTDQTQMTNGLICLGAIEGRGEAVAPDFGNLSRSIVIRSQNPSGFRGHCIFLHRAEVDLVGVAFRDLGRTTVAPLDNTTNRIGRYACHLHHLYGPVNSSKPYQFRLANCSVVRQKKWGIAIHDSHFGQVLDNVIEGSGVETGAGIVGEEGNETGNLIQGNLLRNILGSGQEGNVRDNAITDFGHEGAALWLRSAMSAIRNNRVESCRIGLTVFPLAFAATMRRPKSPGLNTHIDANVDLVDGTDTANFVGIENNDFLDCETCVETWNTGGTADTFRGGTLRGRTGFGPRFTSELRVSDSVIEATDCIRVHAPFGEIPGAYSKPIMFVNLTLRGENGLIVRPEGMRLVDCRFETRHGIKSWYSFNPGDRQFVCNGCSFAGTILEMDALTDGSMNRNHPVTTLHNFLTFFLHLNGQNYRLYLPEQAPDFVPFSSIGTIDTGPMQGKTNQELFDAWGLATWGKLMPPTAVPLPGVTGLVDPISVIPHRPVITFDSSEFDGTMTRCVIRTDVPTELVAAMGFHYEPPRPWFKLSSPFASEHRFEVPGKHDAIFVWVRGANGEIASRTRPE